MVQGPFVEHNELPCRDGFKFEKLVFPTEGLADLEPFFERLPAVRARAGRSLPASRA